METILKTVVRDNFAGVLVIDERGEIISASDAACTILRLPEGPLGRHVEVIASADLIGALQGSIEALRSGTWHEQASKEVSIEVDGETRVLEYVITPSRLSSGKIERGDKSGHECIACLTFSDITDRRRDQDRLSYLARFDILTGLTNRNEFIIRAAAAINGSGGPCAIVCFDLDRFQLVNDTLGHNVGDQLIRAVGKRAQQVATDDTVVARLGGDEFAVLCCGVRAEERAKAFITTLLGQMGTPFPIEGHHLMIGMSAGIAIAYANEDTAADVLMRADTALNRAKAAGGNTSLQFEAGMMEGVAERQALEADLWHALAIGEFELAYQPQFDLGTMRLTGVEALLRWHHPTRGYIQPSEFIPLAEAIGLIGRIGEWVLEEACHTASRWPVAIKIAVNVSPLQFSRGDIVAAVARCLDSSGLSPSQLDLEITESLFFEKSGAVDDALQRLREIGVGLVLDDFGTGYSSLGYLHTYNVDKIKIDRSFVNGIPGDERSVAIIQSVTGLAANLGIRVNAEGVEREEQVALLRLIGCQEGQGFLLGRPRSAQEVALLMREGSTSRIVA